MSQYIVYHIHLNSLSQLKGNSDLLLLVIKTYTIICVWKVEKKTGLFLLLRRISASARK